MNEYILPAAAVLLIILNIISFCLMAYDKHCAKAGRRRVPEKVLFISAALFGGLGGVLGMTLMRHKTKHWYFKLFFPVFLVVQTALLVFAYLLYGGTV
ncbi:MAG: DUF1294 domain-containing protein [Clostridia bacterium]|nr:DUF1294 domain-containing protein [Clostridia bacterium]